MTTKQTALAGINEYNYLHAECPSLSRLHATLGNKWLWLEGNVLNFEDIRNKLKYKHLNNLYIKTILTRRTYKFRCAV